MTEFFKRKLTWVSQLPSHSDIFDRRRLVIIDHTRISNLTNDPNYADELRLNSNHYPTRAIYSVPQWNSTN